MESKRAEDKLQLKTVQTNLQSTLLVQEETNDRLAQLTSELSLARERIKEYQVKFEVLEERIGELTQELEVSVIDKEIAEERVEGLQAECEGLRNRCEGVLVDLEVLKQGNIAGGEGTAETGDEGRDNVAMIQLVRQNERMKDALMRLLYYPFSFKIFV